MPNDPKTQTQTIPITNFGGRLTRILNGDLNSGLAKFTQSFGYDPFSKPQNLTWLEAPVDITGPINNLVVGAKTRFESGVQYVYAVDANGQIYKIQPNAINAPNTDSVVGTSSIFSSNNTFGASIDFFGQNEVMYVSQDNRIVAVSSFASMNTDNTKVTFSNVGTAANVVSNRYHPLKQFAGLLAFGNGPTIGVIDATNTITSSVIGVSSALGNIYSQLNPPLPVETNVLDLDVSPNYDYLLITASGISNEVISTVSSDRQAAASSDGTVFKWNGSDATVTAATTIPSYAVTALQTYLQNNLFFSNDAFGASLNDGVNKILTLQNNKSPFANATGVNGNFLFWVNPELTNDGTGMNASMYYFGSLDQENPPGLFRVMRLTTPLANGFVYQTPVNLLTNNKYMTVNNNITSVVSLGYGKHYFSLYAAAAGSTNSYKLYRFLITSSGTGTPQLGVYETQTQLFSKKITAKQIRVYTEPTVSGNGFQIDLIGSDGNVLTNGTFTYTFAAGTDPTKLQGSLQRIDNNFTAAPTYALGLRITNTGTTNMTIKKVEIDYLEAGK